MLVVLLIIYANLLTKFEVKVSTVQNWQVLCLQYQKHFMQKFRVEFFKFEVKSVAPTEAEVPSNDTFLEEHTGDIIWAIIHAENEEQAREKAEKLAQNLKTGTVSDS